MKQLFLTSSVHAVAHNIAKKINLSEGKNLVFIVTAAEPETGDKQWLQNDKQALIDAGFVVTSYTVTGKNKAELVCDLASFDYLYLSGGNTAYLLQQAEKSGFFSLVQDVVFTKNKTYIGTSAGSIAAGEKCPGYLFEENPNILLKNDHCFGLVNFTILPHWGSNHFKEKYFGGRLATVYREDQVPLLLLTDRQYVHVVDGKMEIVDVLI